MGNNYQTLAIFDITGEGSGVGRTADGLTVFVPGAVPGDTVRCEIVHRKKRFAQARLISIEQASPDRIDPFCEYLDLCGGCRFGLMDYEAQLRVKHKMVVDALTRIGGLADPDVAGIISMESEPFRYRNKAVMHAAPGVKSASTGSTRTAVGFMKSGSHTVIDCKDCLLQSPAAAAAAKVLRKYCAHSGMGDHIKGMTVRTGSGTGEVMVIVSADVKELPDVEEFVEMLDNAVYQCGFASSFSGEISDDTGAPLTLESVFLEQIISGKRKMIKVAGKNTIRTKLGDAVFEISPESFWQVNSVQAKKLYDTVFELATPAAGEKVLDIYCGVGSIGLYISKLMNDSIDLIGIESNRQAVLNANRNAVVNGLVRPRFHAGAAEKLLPELLESGTDVSGAGLAIVDPPRAGCDPVLLDALIELKPERIVYVSCAPATLARDVKYLTQGGYSFVKAIPVDMFPNTGHVETVALLGGEIVDGYVDVNLDAAN
ncbi:MAG: 23S rRNA (uracil(1939)-C(5))-methyltransferase RlmD [Eubacterium sp.]|nr:23S rRNA (uracil(1939)-C(5))-methyltransferase RlmD [Eubacterium sp.]